MALALYRLAGQLIASRRLCAVVAFVAAQPALLYGYALQGSVKELGTATLVALLSALTLSLANAQQREPGGLRVVVPLAVATAAAIATVELGGAPWVGPVLLAALRSRLRGGVPRARRRRRRACSALLALLLSAPALSQLSGYFVVTTNVVTAGEEVGNLIGPSNPLQAVGIWINGDYRLQPGGSWLPLSRLLIVVAIRN